MAKNRYGKMQGNMQYNRPSGGYQKNLYRQQLIENNIKQPKGIEPKTIRIGGIVIGAVWLVLAILLTWKMKWTGLLIALAVGIVVAGALWLFLNHKQKEMIVYYKQIGMTEEMYIKELAKRNGNDAKQLEAARRAWRKVKAEPVIQAPNKKKKK